jgi:8-oxo-dGTP pyrophosphatase MutT (NUDIX family)
MNLETMTFDEIQQRLASRPPLLLSADGRIHASVALILREAASGLKMLFVERAARDGDPWSGDLGFPGGKVEAGDSGPQAAAERETQEEIGFDLGRARYLGRLSDIAGVRLPIQVSCFVYGIKEAGPFHLSGELRDAFWVPLESLMDPESQLEAKIRFGGEVMDCPAIRLPLPEKPLLWGLTHRLLIEFLEILGDVVRKEKEKIACACPNQECDRHSDCESCRAYHEKKGNTPYCERKEDEIAVKQG